MVFWSHGINSIAAWNGSWTVGQIYLRITAKGLIFRSTYPGNQNLEDLCSYNTPTPFFIWVLQHKFEPCRFCCVFFLSFAHVYLHDNEFRECRPAGRCRQWQNRWAAHTAVETPSQCTADENLSWNRPWSCCIPSSLPSFHWFPQPSRPLVKYALLLSSSGQQQELHCFSCLPSRT